MLGIIHGAMPALLGAVLLWAAAFVIGPKVALLMALGEGAQSVPKRKQADAKKNPPMGATGSVIWSNLRDANGKNGGKSVFGRKIPASDRAGKKKFDCTLAGTTDKMMSGSHKAA